MASELSLCLGIGCPIKINGKVYTLSQFTWGMLAEFEEWVRFRYWEEIDESSADLSDLQERYELLERVSIPHCEQGGIEFEDAWNSYEGVIYQTWQRFHRNHPEITLEQVGDWLEGKYGVAIMSRVLWLEKTIESKKASQEDKASLFRSVCAVLTGEPWLLSMDQIFSLTPWQTNEIYFHPRHENGDKIGQIITKEKPLSVHKMQARANRFAEECRAKGMSQAEIEKAWLKKLGIE